MLISHYLHLMEQEGEPFTRKMGQRGILERLAPVFMIAISAGIAHDDVTGSAPIRRKEYPPVRPLLYLSACALLAQFSPAELVSPALTSSNYREIRDAILPSPTKAAWKSVPWRPTLGAAIEEAATVDKPIVRWVMNGNPTGFC